MSDSTQPSADTPQRGKGLSVGEATARLAHDGPNVMPEPSLLSLPAPVILFLRQFRIPLIFVLLLAIVLAQAIHIGAMYTPGLRDILRVSLIASILWLQLLGVAPLLILVDEPHKGWWQRLRGHVYVRA